MTIRQITGQTFTLPNRKDVVFTLVGCEIVRNVAPVWINNEPHHPCIYTFRLSNRENRLCDFYFDAEGRLEKVRFCGQERWFLSLNVAEKNLFNPICEI